MCRQFVLTRANHKSGVIAEQIQRKIVAAKAAELPQLRSDTELISLIRQFKAATEAAERIDAQLTKRLKALGLHDIKYDRTKLEVSKLKLDESLCLVPVKTMERLQKATDLHALGKKAEAEKIWNDVMSANGLT